MPDIGCGGWNARRERRRTAAMAAEVGGRREKHFFTTLAGTHLTTRAGLPRVKPSYRTTSGMHMEKVLRSLSGILKISHVAS